MEFLRSLATDYWLPIHPRLRKAIVFALVTLVMLCVALGSLASKPQSVSANPIATNDSMPVANLAVIYVHVVGAVKHPGVYQLKPGDRVIDAVMAADGFSSRADQASINLARVITDGEQLVVLKLGQSADTPSDAPAKVNLNKASSTELETLPGIGPTLAARLIDWRLANGGFKSVNDLRKVSGIGPKLFEKLKLQVTL